MKENVSVKKSLEGRGYCLGHLPGLLRSLHSGIKTVSAHVEVPTMCENGYFKFVFFLLGATTTEASVSPTHSISTVLEVF